MLSPATLDLEAWRNADLEYVFNFATGAGPINLTGHTFALQVRAQPLAAVAAISLTIGGGLTIVDAVNGRLRAFVNKATLEALPYSGDPFAPSTFYYDLVGTPSGAVLGVYLQGKFDLNPGVTR